MRKSTFIKLLLVLPFIPLSATIGCINNRSEYQKCYERLYWTADAEGLTPKEIDWFVKEILKVEPRGDIAGNFGKTFLVRLFRYLKDSEIEYKEFGFIGQMLLLANLRLDFSEVFNDRYLEMFSGVYHFNRLKALLKNIKSNHRQ